MLTNQYCTSRIIKIFICPDNTKALLIYRKKYLWPNGKKNVHHLSILWNFDFDTFQIGQWITDKVKGVVDFSSCRWCADNKHFLMTFKDRSYYWHHRFVIPPNFSAIPYGDQHSTQGDWDPAKLPESLKEETSTMGNMQSQAPFSTTVLKDGRQVQTENGKLFVDGVLLIDLSDFCYRPCDVVPDL